MYSPVMDVSAAVSLTFEFKYDFYDFLGSDQGSVDVSSDGGANWTTVKSWSFASDRGPKTFTMDATALLGGSTQAQIRFIYDAPGWDWWFEVDDVKLFDPNAPCTPLPGALVAGFVTDANNQMAINGASVESNTGSMTHTMGTPDDPNIPDGFWWNFEGMPGLGPSTRTFTAGANGYVSEEVVLNLVPDTMNQINFALGAGWLEIIPTELSERLYWGEESHQDMDIINHGSADADVALSTVPVKVSWPHASPVKDTRNLPGNTQPKSIGRAQHLGPVAQTPHPNLVLAGVQAYGVNLNTSTLVDWPDVTAPGTWNSISGGMGSYFGGDFLQGDFSTLYVVDYGTNTFEAVDTTSGAATVIGPAVPNGGESWTGLSAAVDGTMYASATTCSASTLYTINVNTGAPAAIGPITNGACIIDIAINAEGDLYGVDLITDSLVKIDTTTGAGTVIGSLGAAANYAQGLDFDEVSGVLYWAAYTASGELRVIDTTTGASTLVGAFPGGAEVDSFAIATSAGGGGLPWLELTPEDGVVPSNEGDLPIDAHFIANGAPHFGLYQAKIKLTQDTPYSVPDVPVCFTKAFDDMPVPPQGVWNEDAYVASVAGALPGIGCGSNSFCPDDAMLRGNAARWLMLLRYGPLYGPPPCTGIFSDVVCESTPNADFIEALFNDGISAGCYYDPNTGERRFCPDGVFSRQQMAVQILRATGMVDQPPYEGLFSDMPVCDSDPNVFCWSRWAEEMFRENITAGCFYDAGSGERRFCPNDIVPRGHMAVFSERSWGLPCCGEFCN